MTEPTRGRGRPARTEEADRIRAAARGQIEAHGLAAFSMRQLAESLQLTNATILHYFGSSRGLLAAVAADGFAELSRHLARQGTASIGDLAAAHADFGLSARGRNLYGAMHAPVLWHDEPAANRSEDRAEHIEQRQKHWLARMREASERAYDLLVRAAAEGQAAGSIGPGDPEQIARVFTGLVDGYLFQVRDEAVKDPGGPRKYVRGLIGHVLHGVRKQGRKPSRHSLSH